MPEGTPDALEAFLSWNWTGITWQRVAGLIALFIFCLIALNIVMRLLGKVIVRLNIEATLQSFIKSLVRALLWFVMLVVILGFLGVPVTSLIALLSVIGLAVSLAIQGTLSNLAGGMMILVSKPFKVGDYIEAGGMAGTVSGINLTYTRLLTIDRRMALIPNSEIASSKIINFSTDESRRVELVVTVDAAVPIGQVREAMLALAKAHAQTLFTPEPTVVLKAIKDGALEYSLRVWCANTDYWTVYFELLEQIHDAFLQSGILMTGGYTRIKTVPERRLGGAVRPE